MNVQQALVYGTKKLEGAAVENAAKDARLLLAHAFGTDAARLFLIHDEDVPAETLEMFNQYLTARKKFQPVSQIIGGREFWGRWFTVTPDVLDPRPDTETLIDIALNNRRPSTLLDLGTGSGILAVSLAAEWDDLDVTATDISAAALKIAEKNAQSLGVSGNINFVQSNWFESVTGTFDLIVSNPPYISNVEMAQLSPDVKNWEPALALTPGGDGLSAYRMISSGLRAFLNEGGLALFEIGYSQAVDVTNIFADMGFKDINVEQDLSGHDRIVVVQG